MIITIVTTKNRIKEFSNALSSVLYQKRKPDEIIAVSSSDALSFKNEEKLCQENGVTLLQNRRTDNLAGALNTALYYYLSKQITSQNINSFSSTYIATLDDDDIWDERYLEECETALTNDEDFVVSGLTRVEDARELKLKIPHELSIDDFLKGNPHIQGSNTFVRLDTLLKAGLFDENMPSCTDRDIFTRIMMLKPVFKVVDKYLVVVNAKDSHKRITNDNSLKKDGLRKFYYKYQDLMSKEVEEEFFDRSERFFHISKYDIVSAPIEVREKEPPLLIKNSSPISLVVGYIASSYSLGLRLLKQILELKEDKLKVVILINFTESVSEYEKLLKDHKMEYVLLKKDEFKREVIDYAVVPKESVSLLDGATICDISIARTILQFYLYKETRDGDVIWILDDDMELKTLYLDEERPTLENITNLNDVINTYRYRCDAAIGGYCGGAPLPILSTLRSSLVDYLYSSFASKDKREYHMEAYNDYYYDLSVDTYSHLETPYNFNASSIENIFNGKEITRPLYFDYHEGDSVNSRGGNTLIFNREILKVPNFSLPFSHNRIARRSDYLWTIIAKKHDYKIIKIPLTTFHNRGEIIFDYEKESEKLLSDLVGASFTHAIEISSRGDSSFDEAFYSFYNDRLACYVASYYRIIGILEIIKDEKYKIDFNERNLSRFIRKCLDAVDIDNLYSHIRVFDKTYEKFYLNQRFHDDFLYILNRYYHVSTPIDELGYGDEGIVFTDQKTIYKFFFKIPTNIELLKECAPHFSECPILYNINIDIVDNHLVLTYPYEKTVPYESGHQDDFISFISFLRKYNVAYDNFKKENFVINEKGELKLIDYGKSFLPLTEKLDKKMCDRVYEILFYSDLSPASYKELIEQTYRGRSKGINFNSKNVSLLAQNREKDEIHDDKLRELIDKYSPTNIFDYGAGKCHIANSYARKCQVGVYDIDQDTLTRKADKNIRIYKTIEEVEDNSYDFMINNLVLCCVPNDMADFITSNMARILKVGGHLILSFCNPFFNEIKHTEDRANNDFKDYHEMHKFHKSLKTGDTREEYHRPIEFYINLLRRNGFEILNSSEIDSVNRDSYNSIGEFIVLECELKNKVRKMDNCSLLIKACPMDHKYIYENIKHIVLSLEKGDQFSERLVVVDNCSINERTRKYSDDNYEALINELERAKVNCLIDRYIVADDSDNISITYQKWFGVSSSDGHSSKGAPNYMTLFGFDSINTPYVYHTDCDILIHNEEWGGMSLRLEDMVRLNAVTAALSCPRTDSIAPSYGGRVSVRSGFIDLDKLRGKLPLFNELENGATKYAWHRSLDASLDAKESLRFMDSLIYYIHPANCDKNDLELVPIIRDNIKKGNTPIEQYNTIELVSDLSKWLVNPKTELVIYIRGYNTSIEKVKRLLDSLATQTYKDYILVYIDDGSNNGSEDYISFIAEYDDRFKDKIILVRNQSRLGTLPNLIFAMNNIITNKDSIIVNIDNDDALLKDTALERIKKEFDNGADLTCGNLFRVNKPLKKYTIHSFSKVYERRGDNVWLHPKCFRRYLFDSVDTESDLKINGEYVNNCIDYAFMFPLILASKNPVFIDEELYYYEPCSDNVNYVNEYSKENEEHIKNILLERMKEKDERK